MVKTSRVRGGSSRRRSRREGVGGGSRGLRGATYMYCSSPILFQIARIHTYLLLTKTSRNRAGPLLYEYENGSKGTNFEPWVLQVLPFFPVDNILEALHGGPVAAPLLLLLLHRSRQVGGQKESQEDAITEHLVFCKFSDMKGRKPP